MRFLCSEWFQNAFAVGAAPQNPTGEAYNSSSDPLASEEGLAATFPRTPPPLSAFGLEVQPFGPHTLALCVSSPGPSGLASSPFATTPCRKALLFISLYFLLQEDELVENSR